MKDELVSLLCPDYYKFVDVTRSSEGPPDPVPGQVVSAHTVYPPDEPWIIKVHAYNAANPTLSRYEVKKFEKGDETHFPIAEMQLRKDENYYVYRGKQRPLVVVGAVKSEWSNALYPEKLFLCAPLFSFKPKHTDVFKIKCVGFCYPTLFYLPASPNGCGLEGAIRFEYSQPIAKQCLHNYFAGSPSRPVALSDIAFALFMNHLGRFLFKKDFDPEVCEQMDAYRALVVEQLEKVSPAN